MGHKNLLEHFSLKKIFNLEEFGFKSTEELGGFEGIIGQERAVSAMEFGLKINTKGYNIYICGPSGAGKTSYAINLIKGKAQAQKVPDDWCYIYNFKNPTCPVALSFLAGEGKVFQKDMDEFIKVIETELPKAFESEDYDKEKTEVLKDFQTKKNDLLEQLSKDAEKLGFKVKSTNTGIYFLPVIEGKTVDEKEYIDLSDDVKDDISKRSDIIQIETMDIMRKLKSVEKEAEDKIVEWDNKLAIFAVGIHINDLKKKYEGNEKIIQYLDGLQEDILENLNDFLAEEEIEDQQAMMSLLRRNVESPAEKYRVNLVVDNSQVQGAPVIVDYNPSFYNLMGKLEYDNEFGTMTTDFKHIKGGLIHQANGGYLILQAKDVMSSNFVWEALKRVMRTREIGIENVKEQMGMVAVSTLKPEPIPVNIKLVLVGSEYLYQMLLEYDEDFSKFFKVKVDFEEVMDRTPQNVNMLAQFIGSFCRREGVKHFDPSGVSAVVEHSSRLVEDQNKLTTRFNDIVEVLAESCTWAEIDGSELVSSSHVKKAIEQKHGRSNKYDKRLLEYMQDGTIIIDTEGMVVGQINGLSVLDMGDYTFGKPSRITATTYMGKSGIVNIEREVEMSGTSHTKGVLILNGYMGQKYAQDMPLSLTANLCFEQLYSGVDGDSASSTELYAILSSLSELPIKQGIAVTGSVNQRGEIQPIGGVNEKIEGFFELCYERGLTGEQGVMIPVRNSRNLMLSDEVIEAVKKGKFHIYAISTISEGIEILTGVEAGEISKETQDENNKNNKNNKNNSKVCGHCVYPKGSVNYLVYEKLKRFSEATEKQK